MRLIDADEFAKEIAKIDDLRKISTKSIGEALKRTPTINAAPIRYGEWVYIGDRGMSEIYGCTQCGTKRVEHLRSPFCPGCGANMVKRTESN